MKMYYTKQFQIKTGDVIVNLGACIGKATLYFSWKVGPKGLVVAVEPVVENYRKLVQTLIFYKLSNVIPLMVAISNKTTATIMNLADPIKRYVCHSLVYPQKYGKRVVPTISWDVLMTVCGLSHVDLMKMDIEGGETEVLKGMTKVFPDKIVLEEHIRLEKNPDKVLGDILTLLSLKGYKILKREHVYLYCDRA